MVVPFLKCTKLLYVLLWCLYIPLPILYNEQVIFGWASNQILEASENAIHTFPSASKKNAIHTFTWASKNAIHTCPLASENDIHTCPRASENSIHTCPLASENSIHT